MSDNVKPATSTNGADERILAILERIAVAVEALSGATKKSHGKAKPDSLALSGLVDSFFERKGKGPWRAGIGGTWFQTFSGTTADVLREAKENGDVVAISYSEVQNKGYTNNGIDAVTVVDAAAPAPVEDDDVPF